jgi:hypothetical protein
LPSSQQIAKSCSARVFPCRFRKSNSVTLEGAGAL